MAQPDREPWRLPPAGFLEDRGHFLEATPLRERERCFARAVGKVDVSAGIRQRLERCDMTFAAVTEHDRLDYRGPAEVVDVVERRLGGDQRAHDLVVTEVRGGEIGRASCRERVSID